jgi:esterase/lipase superfamily enzyme
VHFERHVWFSGSLGHDMEVLVYGHAGQPLVCFPSQDGRAGDWAGFGMIDACADLIEGGRLIAIAVDGVDWQSWTNSAASAADRARRNDEYHRYIVDEVVPFARMSGSESLWATGCSMGAFHAANAFFKRPDAFDGLIALSGLYQPRLFIGDYSDDHVYFNSPLYYLPNMSDAWHIERYRRSRIVFCCGQGAWEDESLRDHRAIQDILWQKMLRHHLSDLGW